MPGFSVIYEGRWELKAYWSIFSKQFGHPDTFLVIVICSGNFVDDEDEEEFVEDPYGDSLSAAIAESAALAERESQQRKVEAKQRKIIKKDSYFSDEEDEQD